MLITTFALKLAKSGSGATSRALAWAAGLIERFGTALARRRQLHELLELDDRALKDIGLVRSDVSGATREGMIVSTEAGLRLRAAERYARQRGLETALRRLALRAAQRSGVCLPQTPSRMA